MNRSILLTAISCLTVGITAGVLTQQYLTNQALNRKTARQSVRSSEPSPIGSNEAIAEITKIFAELPNLPSGEVGPVAISRFNTLAGRLDANVFPHAARIALAQHTNSSRSMLTGLMRSWVKTDLGGAQGFLSGLGGNQRRLFVRAMVQALNRETQQSLGEWILQSDDATLKDIGYAELGAKLRHLNPTNAYKIWLRFPDEWRTSQGWLLFSQWAHDDPIAATKAMAPHAEADRQLRSTMERALAQWIQRDADDAVAFLIGMPDNEFRRELISANTSSLGQWAPQKGLALIRSLPQGISRQQLTQQLMARWAEANPADAFEAARNLPEGSERKSALAATLVRAAERSPEKVKAFMISEPSHPAIVENSEIIARHLVGTNFTILLEWAQQIPSGRTRDSMLLQGISSLELAHPGEAIALAQKHLAPQYRQLAIRRILIPWSRNDAVEAARFADQVLQGEERSSALATVVAEWVVTDAEAATRWVRSLPANAERQPAEREIIRRLAGKNPGKAAEFAALLPESPHRGDMIAMVAQEWGKLDLKAAADWLRAQPASVNNDQAYKAAALAYLEIDPNIAAEFAEKSPPKNGSNATRISFALAWAKTDPEASAKWMAKLASDDIYISSTFNDVFGKWARRDPKAALDYLEKVVFAMTNGFHASMKNSCKQTAISHWASQEPDTLLQRIAAESPDLAAENTWKWVLSQWASRNPAAVYRWLQQVPDDRNRVLFAEHSAPFIAAQQPDLAVQSLSLIPEPTNRDRVMESIYRAWNQQDRARAKDWLRTNSLPAATKERLTREAN